MLYDDGEWYEGILGQSRNANKQFLISFEDGEKIWSVLHPFLVKAYPKVIPKFTF